LYLSGLFQALQNSITGDGAFPLKQGVAVFPSQAFPPAPTYVDLVQNVFGGKTQTLSYASQQEATYAINSWAESQTSERVKDVVVSGASGGLDSQTQLLLVSVAYYQSKEERHRTFMFMMTSLQSCVVTQGHVVPPAPLVIVCLCPPQV